MVNSCPVDIGKTGVNGPRNVHWANGQARFQCPLGFGLLSTSYPISCPFRAAKLPSFASWLFGALTTPECASRRSETSSREFGPKTEPKTPPGPISYGSPSLVKSDFAFHQTRRTTFCNFSRRMDNSGHGEPSIVAEWTMHHLASCVHCSSSRCPTQSRSSSARCVTHKSGHVVKRVDIHLAHRDVNGDDRGHRLNEANYRTAAMNRSPHQSFASDSNSVAFCRSYAFVIGENRSIERDRPPSLRET
jgi:hypothetical protein